MPELPEVETTRRTIAQHVLGLRVADVTVHRRDVVTGPEDPKGGFSRQRGDVVKPGPLPREQMLRGTKISALHRHGKQIAIEGDAGPAVGVQLGMTGQLLFAAPGKRLASRDHVHVTWRLRDHRSSPAGQLVFRDPRRFGGLNANASMAELVKRRWAELGPDALTVIDEALHKALRQTDRAIKSVLLDQSVIAGVGNIYADESLHRAGVAPQAVASGISRKRVLLLGQSIRTVLAEAIEARGSTLRDYADGNGSPGLAQRSHRVYGRGGLPCLSCKAVLQKTLVAQRTTVWCSRCQRG
ncbi:MAG: bifunctional DNA-formamidopyrimidine glycosylase/DNA-(apurinic or apyrimidinic site) lyase [Planctomycetota bacterium]